MRLGRNQAVTMIDPLDAGSGTNRPPAISLGLMHKPANIGHDYCAWVRAKTQNFKA
jgi:hypothetical protein